jgi:hypothetical protein
VTRLRWFVLGVAVGVVLVGLALDAAVAGMDDDQHDLLGSVGLSFGWQAASPEWDEAVGRTVRAAAAQLRNDLRAR